MLAVALTRTCPARIIGSNAGLLWFAKFSDGERPSADVARFLGVMLAERVLATEQRPGQTRGSEATSGSEG